jgi:hypothetical protein
VGVAVSTNPLTALIPIESLVIPEPTPSEFKFAKFIRYLNSFADCFFPYFAAQAVVEGNEGTIPLNDVKERTFEGGEGKASDKVVIKVQSREEWKPQLRRKKLSFPKFIGSLRSVALCFFTTFAAQAVVESLDNEMSMNGRKGSGSAEVAAFAPKSTVSTSIESKAIWTPIPTFFNFIPVLRYLNLYANCFLPSFAAQAVVEGDRFLLLAGLEEKLFGSGQGFAGDKVGVEVRLMDEWVRSLPVQGRRRVEDLQRLFIFQGYCCLRV